MPSLSYNHATFQALIPYGPSLRMEVSLIPMTLLETTPLSKKYGRDWIIRDLQFSLTQGEVVALLGPNGVGKTTLLRLLAGLIRPSSGQIKRNGQVALLANPPAFHRHFSGEENLHYALRLEGRKDDKAAITAAMQQVGLPLGKAVMSYSSGMKKRLAMARLSLMQPDIWLLDEPEAALDSQGRALLEQLVETGKRSGGVIVATHDRTWLQRATRVLELGVA